MWQRVLMSVMVIGLAGCAEPTPATAPAAAPGDAASTGAGNALALPTQFIAFGNEPFWSVRVDGQALHWSSPDNLDGLDFVARVEAMDNGRRYAGELEGAAVTLSISAGLCSDGTSDALHPWTARWQHQGRLLQGCARPL